VNDWVFLVIPRLSGHLSSAAQPQKNSNTFVRRVGVQAAAMRSGVLAGSSPFIAVCRYFRELPEKDSNLH
jgi:hypothetical protein